MRVRKTLVFTAVLLVLATAFFALSLPRPPLMASKFMWFFEPMHYLMIVGWPIIAFKSFGPVLGLGIAAVFMVAITALFSWLWRGPHLSIWLSRAIFIWIATGTLLVWSEIIASI